MRDAIKTTKETLSFLFVRIKRNAPQLRRAEKRANYTANWLICKVAHLNCVASLPSNNSSIFTRSRDSCVSPATTSGRRTSHHTCKAMVDRIVTPDRIELQDYRFLTSPFQRSGDRFLVSGILDGHFGHREPRGVRDGADVSHPSHAPGRLGCGAVVGVSVDDPPVHYHGGGKPLRVPRHGHRWIESERPPSLPSV
jgi:hypothetical protein